ncbi:hypothetical protein ILUMI_05725 [Ignelater luminosus]|uniref:Uncharacterized protein n=1 Tax=Ignelater luminosus TaxID=2038154 RepID=A0A8K0DH46_IGNLU|nr:hypothetical protein ILUMI_05725 [Ignelater luminosus]
MDRSLKSSGDEGRRAGVYSPITFQDVARRSIASSPIKDSSSAKGSRSNSTSAIIYTANNSIVGSPSKIFGCVVNDNGEYNLDESFPMVNSKSSNQVNSNYRKSKTPPKVGRSKSEVGFPKDPPAILVKKSSDNQFKSKHSTTTQPNYCCKCNINQQTNGHNHSNRTPSSKSDGDLVGMNQNHLLNTVPSSYSQNFKSHYPQECCTGFGSGRHRLQSNACVIV